MDSDSMSEGVSTLHWMQSLQCHIVPKSLLSSLSLTSSLPHCPSDLFSGSSSSSMAGVIREDVLSA